MAAIGANMRYNIGMENNTPKPGKIGLMERLAVGKKASVESLLDYLSNKEGCIKENWKVVQSHIKGEIDDQYMLLVLKANGLQMLKEDLEEELQQSLEDSNYLEGIPCLLLLDYIEVQLS